MGSAAGLIAALPAALMLLWGIRAMDRVAAGSPTMALVGDRRRLVILLGVVAVLGAITFALWRADEQRKKDEATGYTVQANILSATCPLPGWAPSL